MRAAILAVAMLLGAGCGADPSDASGVDRPDDDDDGHIASDGLTAPGRYHVLGHDRLLGAYGDYGVALELVNGLDGGISVLTLFGRTGADASGIALSVDERRGWAELHSVQIGAAPTLPLLFFVDGEQMRITPEGRTGFGTSRPAARVEVAGGVRLNPGGRERPACDSERRGTLWFARGTEGQEDILSICMRDAAHAHRWRVIAP